MSFVCCPGSQLVNNFFLFLLKVWCFTFMFMIHFKLIFVGRAFNCLFELFLYLCAMFLFFNWFLCICVWCWNKALSMCGRYSRHWILCLSTHIGYLTTSCNSNPRISDTVFWSLWACSAHGAHTYTHTFAHAYKLE